MLRKTWLTAAGVGGGLVIGGRQRTVRPRNDRFGAERVRNVLAARHTGVGRHTRPDAEPG